MSRTIDGREPTGAQIYSEDPFCPTRLIAFGAQPSWNQISTGLPAAEAGSASLTRPGQFFKSLLGSGVFLREVLLGRWLLPDPRVLLLYDVTRGVDVATKHEIYQLMIRLAGEGRGILFYSSDAQELAELCHRVLVMREGRIAAELVAPDITAEQIVAAAIHERIAA